MITGAIFLEQRLRGARSAPRPLRDPQTPRRQPRRHDALYRQACVEGKPTIRAAK